MKRAKELEVKITVPVEIVRAVIKAQRDFISGKSSNEFDACQIVTSWLFEQVDTAVEINDAILSAYDMQYGRKAS